MQTRSFALVLILTIAGCAAPPQGSDLVKKPKENLLVVTGGTILAGTELTPLRDVAVLIRNGRIDALIPAAEAARLANAVLVDASGATILPGLIDAHAHIDNLGKSLDIVDLRGATSFDEVLRRVAEHARRTPAGEWIEGRGWDQNAWEVKEYPTAAMIDRIIGDHPVWLDRVDGHASVANSAAMRAARITAATPDPSGGRILRHASGEPTGVFIDDARELVKKFIPPPSRAALASRIERAAQMIARTGLTAIHQAGNADDDEMLIEIVKELIDQGRMPIRIYMMLSSDPEVVDRWLGRGPLLDYGNRLTIRSVKLYSDGALGSRGAALLAPYSDEPENIGLLTTSREQLATTMRRGLERGFQVNVHAIGDRGARTVLEAAEQAGVREEHRFRIEHLQIIALEDIPRLAHLGIIASMQPTHATSDMYWAEDRVGKERIRGGYAWRSLLNAGARLAFGSDFPVEAVNPFFGIHAAVTRQDQKGWPPGGWYPAEAVTLREAIRGFSAEAAWAAFEEQTRGTIEPGKFADLTIVEGDLLETDPSRLFETKVRYTIVNGEIVYDARR
ncbi:MAG TPA: amidohydrolase [Thermoanaerobaculia bacterium]|nr:amidohydrolase [Thermoanaerobaculia bacterium]